MDYPCKQHLAQRCHCASEWLAIWLTFLLIVFRFALLSNLACHFCVVYCFAVWSSSGSDLDPATFLIRLTDFFLDSLFHLGVQIKLATFCIRWITLQSAYFGPCWGCRLTLGCYRWGTAYWSCLTLWTLWRAEFWDPFVKPMVSLLHLSTVALWILKFPFALGICPCEKRHMS